MLRSAVALLLALSCAAADSDATVAPAAAEPVAATVPSDDTAAMVLAAARSASFFYQNHFKHLADDLNSPDQQTRLTAMSTLGQTQDPEAVVLLVPLLEGGKRLPADIAGACQAAASLGFPGGVSPLIRQLLTHADSGVRLAAYNALAVLEARNPGDSLIASKDADVITGAAAQTDLGVIAHAEAGPILAKALASDGRSHVRRMAAIGLARLGNKDFAGALQNALIDPDVVVRRYAARGLARLQYTAAIPFMLIALESNIAGNDIAQALTVMTGEDFGFKATDTILLRNAAIERGFAWWTPRAQELGG